MMGLVVYQSKFDVRYVVYAIGLVRVDFIANPGAVPSVNEGQIGEFRLPVPALSEQIQIAAFLDRETSKIDQLIAEQQRLIELLKETRQAAISRAVKKGLNPDVPLKPSGVEWLGDVPAHLGGNSLKRIAEVHTGVAKGKDNGARMTIIVPYLRVANVQDGYLNLETVATMRYPRKTWNAMHSSLAHVLMNEGGDFDKLGRGYIWDGQKSIPALLKITCSRFARVRSRRRG